MIEYLYMMKNKTSSHHLLPKSKKGTWCKENRIDLKENYHRSFHKVFENDTPIEQIERILKLNESAIQWDFKADIEKVIELYKDLYYHLWVKK